MPHILIVCTANICRSPVAEGLLRRMFAERSMEGWTVGSAGTWAEDGLPAARNSVSVAARRGIDISGHQSRLVTAEMIREADLVLCMELGHAEALRVEFADDAHKIHLLSALSGPPYSVPDPFGSTRAQYQRMLEEVEGLLSAGFDRLIEKAGAPG